jgi:hypothetical protein
MAVFDPAVLRNWAIHVPDQAAPPVRFAAEELQRYLQVMTDTRVPLRWRSPQHGPDHIVLGAHDAPADTGAPASAYALAVIPEESRITLAGGSPRAVLEAVYVLLEQLGCCWSLDGPAGESVPRLRGAVALQTVQRTPRFAVRGYSSDIMTWHYTQPEYVSDRAADDRAFIDWMGKSGANVFFYIRHPFDTQLTIPELLPEFQQRGIGLEYGGHVIPLLLPRQLFREHADYFPQSAEGTRTDFGNLCTSNAAALATACANAVQYVREYPEMRALHVWGADLWRGGWCNCGECEEMSAQDQGVRVCNAVARALSAGGVGRPVCYLAYHDTIEPNLRVRPEDDVMVEFAPRERCYGHALNDPTCATNGCYAAALERYADLFDGRVRMFEYYGDAILFFGCTVPLAEVIAADLDYYRRLGVGGITMLQFGRFSAWAYPLNCFAFAAGVTCGGRAESLRDQYCRRFEPQARQVRALLAQLEQSMQTVVTYGDIRRPPRSPAAARHIVPRLEAALPRLAQVADGLQRLRGPELEAQAALIRYTHAVLGAVRDDLRAAVAGTPVAAAYDRYAGALEIMEAVDARFKGLWGRMDLPMIHNFYAAGEAVEACGGAPAGWAVV